MKKNAKKQTPDETIDSFSSPPDTDSVDNAQPQPLPEVVKILSPYERFIHNLYETNRSDAEFLTALKDNPEIATHTDEKGFNALIHSGFTKRFAVSKKLLELSADPSAQSTGMGWTVLIAHVGSTDESFEMCKLIVKKGAKVDAMLHEGGLNALTAACTHGNTPLIDLLLEHKAPINTVLGHTPMVAAAKSSDPSLLLKLHKAGGHLDQPETAGYAPAHSAASSGRHDNLAYLAEHKVNLNAMTRLGDTPLHFASSHEHEKSVEILLKFGANPAIENRSGQIPAEVCKDAALKEILKKAAGSKRIPHPDPINAKAKKAKNKNSDDEAPEPKAKADKPKKPAAKKTLKKSASKKTTKAAMEKIIAKEAKEVVRSSNSPTVKAKNSKTVGKKPVKKVIKKVVKKAGPKI